MEEFDSQESTTNKKIVRPQKEAGTSSQRPTRGVSQTKEEDKEEEILSEDSERSEDSKNTDTYTKQDPFIEHPAQPEHWDIYDEAKERERKKW